MSAKWIGWITTSRTYSKMILSPKKKPILSQEDYNKFIKAYPVIADNTLKRCEFIKCSEHVKRIIEYNTREQDRTQGEITLLCNKILQEHTQVGKELEYKQHVLAWCNELVFTYGVVTDDFEEGSKTRYNKTCWHLLPEVGTLVMNDSLIIQSLLCEALRQNFEGSTYVELIKIINETLLKYSIGQHLDAEMSANRNYKNFTIEQYETLAFNKLGFYSIILPVKSALILSKKHNEDSFNNVTNIFTDIGIWSQINNDIQDFFNGDARTGKSGSDIEMGKCTWLAVTALQRCNEIQRKEFEECYASWEPSHVKRIRDLYKELNLIDIYFEEEKTRYNNAISKIYSLPSNTTPSRDFFRLVLDKYYSYLSYRLKP